MIKSLLDEEAANLGIERPMHRRSSQILLSPTVNRRGTSERRDSKTGGLFGNQKDDKMSGKRSKGSDSTGSQKQHSLSVLTNSRSHKMVKSSRREEKSGSPGK